MVFSNDTKTYDDRTGAPVAPKACFFDYARTRAFAHQEADDHSIYREAHEHPLTGKWYIMEVTLRPNTRKTSSDQQPEFVEDSQFIKSKSDLTFPEALSELGKFERWGDMTPMIVATGESIEELGEEHFSHVATEEQIALEVEGKAHPTIGGRIVSEGKFDPQMRKQLRQANQNPPPNQKHRSVPGLAELFNPAKSAPDFERYLDKYEELSQWRDFMKTLKQPFVILMKIQDENFDWAERSGIFVSYEVRGADRFEKELKNARKTIENNALVNSNELQVKCTNYLKALELTFYVGLAKSCFYKLKKLNSGNKANSYRGRLNYARDMAVKTLQDMGGTAQDIENMKAEIVSSPSFTRIHEDGLRYPDTEKMPDESENDKARQLYKKLEDHNITRCWQEVYYLPDKLIRFLDDLKTIEQDFEKDIERQSVRLNDKCGKPQEASHSGELASQTPNP